jgi:hypothetical protein
VQFGTPKGDPNMKHSSAISPMAWFFGTELRGVSRAVLRNGSQTKESELSKRDDELFHIGYEKDWQKQPCAICQSRDATSHGYLYRDEVNGVPDANEKRSPVGEVFQHEDGEDCVRIARSALKPT